MSAFASILLQCYIICAIINDACCYVYKPPEYVCSLKIDRPTICRLRLYRYFYNSTSNECMRLSYGGCFGNENRFATLQACIRKCIERDGQINTTTETVTTIKNENLTTQSATITTASSYSNDIERNIKYAALSYHDGVIGTTQKNYHFGKARTRPNYGKKVKESAKHATANYRTRAAYSNDAREKVKDIKVLTYRTQMEKPTQNREHFKMKASIYQIQSFQAERTAKNKSAGGRNKTIANFKYNYQKISQSQGMFKEIKGYDHVTANYNKKTTYKNDAEDAYDESIRNKNSDKEYDYTYNEDHDYPTLRIPVDETYDIYHVRTTKKPLKGRSFDNNDLDYTSNEDQDYPTLRIPVDETYDIYHVRKTEKPLEGRSFDNDDLDYTYNEDQDYPTIGIPVDETYDIYHVRTTEKHWMGRSFDNHDVETDSSDNLDDAAGPYKKYTDHKEIYDDIGDSSEEEDDQVAHTENIDTIRSYMRNDHFDTETTRHPSDEDIGISDRNPDINDPEAYTGNLDESWQDPYDETAEESDAGEPSNESIDPMGDDVAKTNLEPYDYVYGPSKKLDVQAIDPDTVKISREDYHSSTDEETDISSNDGITIDPNDGAVNVEDIVIPGGFWSNQNLDEDDHVDAENTDTVIKFREGYYSDIKGEASVFIDEDVDVSGPWRYHNLDEDDRETGVSNNNKLLEAPPDGTMKEAENVGTHHNFSLGSHEDVDDQATKHDHSERITESQTDQAVTTENVDALNHSQFDNDTEIMSNEDDERSTPSLYEVAADRYMKGILKKSDDEERETKVDDDVTNYSQVNKNVTNKR